MERLARSQPSLSRPLDKLADLSASVALLCAEAERDQAIWKNPSVRAYVNSRLLSSIRHGLHRGDFDRARQAAHLLLDPIPLAGHMLRTFFALPDPVLRILVAHYRRTREGLRRRLGNDQVTSSKRKNT
jgi:hypothetical protein